MHGLSNAGGGLRGETRLGAAGVMVALAVLTWTPRGQACDCSGPGPRFLIPDGYVLPANARAIPFASSSSIPLYGGPQCEIDGGPPAPGKDAFTIHRLDTDSEQAVAFDVSRVMERRPGRLHRCASLVLLVVRDPLVPATRYRINGPGASITIGVSRKTIPSSAGVTLEFAPPEESNVRVAAGGACSMEQTATVRSVRMVLPPPAREFAQALLFTTYVDGDVWRPSPSMCGAVDVGRSWKGLGEDALYGGCSSYGGLTSLRPHEVRMRAVLPGTDVLLESETKLVAAFCKPDPPVRPPWWARWASCSVGAPNASPWALLLTLAWVTIAAGRRARGRDRVRRDVRRSKDAG